MNSRPMIFRFSSGSETPASAARNCSRASTTRRSTPVTATKSRSICSVSPCAHQPVVDVDAGEPVTDGPLHQRRGDGGVDAARQRAQRPARRRSASRIRSTCSSTTLAIVQVGSRPAMSNRKCSSTVCPCAVCRTSGWNCTPASLRSTSSNAATGRAGRGGGDGEPGRRRARRRPRGSSRPTARPAARRTAGPPVVTVSGVPPYSRSPVWATVPPRLCAMAWKP